MKKILRKLKIANIDSHIYYMSEYKAISIDLKYPIEKTMEGSKTLYFIKDEDRIIHKSYVFPKVFLLGLINRKGPAIGDCVTVKSHRGQSIYPFVLNKIAFDHLNNNGSEIFVIVDKDNHSSIKGIEKAGFTKRASVKAKRWLWFYLKKEVVLTKNINNN